MPEQYDLQSLLAELYSLQSHGIRPGLETTVALLAELGNPEKNLPCIHVAGSNGKGSVCAMLESILRSAGLRTALYTSPHLIRFNERIRIDGKCIPDEALAALLPEVLAAGRRIAKKPDGRAATFFEIVTALAFKYFHTMSPDIAIIETGLGGRLDATNVVNPLAAVITGISIEHTRYLGSTLAEIAGEKAGIIKPGRPVVVGQLPEEAMAVIRAVARERKAPLIELDSAARVDRRRQSPDGQQFTIETTDGTQLSLKLPLPGRHQLRNAALAVIVLERVLGEKLPISAVKTGLEQTCWPARLQIVDTAPLTILDAAHNPEGASICAAALRELLPAGTPLGLIIGMCDDKDVDGFLAAFGNTPKYCWTTPLANPRGRRAADIAAAASRRGWPTEAMASADAAWAAARDWAGNINGAICITGSIFLAGEILAMLPCAGDIFNKG